MAISRKQVISDIETYLLDYSAFPSSSWAFVLSLWTIGTWTYQTFDAFPYLVITSATKRSGKTRLAELLSPLCRNPFNFAAMTAAVLFRTLESAGEKGATIFFDEAEKLSSEAASDMRSVLNVGYRRGQSIPRVVQGEVVQFPAYGPKVFILIGDVFDTLRDRSIVVEMVRGIPRRTYRWSEAQARAQVIAAYPAMQQPFANGWVEPYDCTGFLEGREAEIWSPLFTICREWCPERMPELTRAAVDLAADKTAPKRRYSELAQAEEETEETSYAERALRDLAHVMGNERARSTDDVIERLKGIDSAPWRKYRGEGLTPVLLSHLLSRFAVAPRLVKIRGKVSRGYQSREIVSAVRKLHVKVTE